MKYSLYLLLLMCFMAYADSDVYRTVDEYGHIIFSDKPTADSEKIELKPLSTYSPSEVPQSLEIQEEEQLQDVAPAYHVTIVSPKQNESFWENAGNVSVTLDITPELNQERGDQLVFSLDGHQVGEPQSASTLILNEVDRGSHILIVSVIDSTGKILSKSKSTLFHLHRRSVAR